MFWECFSYDKKGPYHIWKAKSAQAKKEATKAIDQWNAENKARLREEWQVKTDLRRQRADGSKPRGKTPQ
jgi:hypothetical protein